MNTLPRIAIFASGNGSNAQRIVEYFRGKDTPEIAAIYCNNPSAYVLERAKKLEIPTVLFDRESFRNTKQVLDDLKQRKVSWIILAGFLWLIPDYLIQAFPKRIVNIHPALLPKYGGKGMYGEKVHEAVLAAGDKESGITIHFVNDRYDEGEIIFQAKCPVLDSDTPQILAARIHELEYKYYPQILEELISGGGVA
jgi:phosphoribosylglycinamide formyltransferase-1